MSLIRKPAELEIQPTIQALIYGQAGTGKTTLALSAPAPLLLDFDNGVGRVNYGHRVDTVQITSYKDALSVVNDEDLSKYQTIVIDTGGKLLDYMSDAIINDPQYQNNRKIVQRDKTLGQGGYGVRKSMFKNFCKTLRIKKKHLIFVAQREEKMEGDEIRYAPVFGGSSYADLVSELDLVGYMEARGRARIITFDPTNRNDGKNTINMPPAMEIPIVVDEQGAALPNEFFDKMIIGKFKQNIEDSKKFNETFGEIMEFVKANVEAVTDAETANEVSDKLKALHHVGNSRIYASRMLDNHCKAIGLKLNKEKRYEAA